MGEAAVPHGVPARHRARHAASQDVQVARQRHRSARCRARLRRRCAALDGDRGHSAWASTCMLDPDDLDKSFAPGRNFCTKLWNIGRFLLTSVGTDPVTPLDRVDAARAHALPIAGSSTGSTQRIADCDAALGPARPDERRAWRPKRTHCADSGSRSMRRRRDASSGTSSPTGIWSR